MILRSSFDVACVFAKAMALSAVVVLAAFAQNPRGALRGTVQDASGARVVGAKIVLTSPQLSIMRETQADLRGEFLIEELTPSPYQLSVNATGFTEARSTVVVAISTVNDVNVTLQPKSVAEKVLVNAVAQSITTEPLDTASAVHQAVIYRARSGDDSSCRAQLREYRLPGAGHGTGRAFRSDQSSHHRRFHRRQFRTEQRTFRRRRRQLRRLHRRISAEFFARRDSGICVSHGAGGCRHGPHHGWVPW